MDCDKKIYTRENFREKLGIAKDVYMVTMIAKNSEESNRKAFDSKDKRILFNVFANIYICAL